MSDQPEYNLGAIRDLLAEAFSPAELRRLCQDNPPLDKALTYFADKASLRELVGELIDFCLRRALVGNLLAAVADARSEIYGRYDGQIGYRLGLPAYEPPPLPDLERLPAPGRLPPGSRLPFGRNALFTGRKRHLIALARALLYVEPSSTHVTRTVQGMGGIGKTQLAVEFAHRYGRYFGGVHWLDCAESDAISAEITSCGSKMQLRPWPRKRADQVERTLAAWSGIDRRRLVILDNLEDTGAAREWLQHLRSVGTAQLVTARFGRWPKDLGVESLRLRIFTLDESLEFLRQYLPADRATDQELSSLAERLGRLPLALELAGRYLHDTRVLSVGAYLQRIDQGLSHPSMRDWEATRGSPTDHDLNLAHSFALSWERVEDTAARRLFRVVGHCAPNRPIPNDLLQQALDLDQEDYALALGRLVALGLLDLDDPGAGPSIHPLLADFALTVPPDNYELGDDAFQPLASLAAAMESMARELSETGFPMRLAPLRPHLAAVAPAAERAKLDQAAALWSVLGWHLHDVAAYRQAQAAYERALAVRRKELGKKHPDTAAVISDLGILFVEQNKYAKARTYLKRSLAIRKKKLGKKHPDTATAFNDLGNLFSAQGKYVKARTYLERALAIRRKALGKKDLATAVTLNDLGLVHSALNDFQAARAHFERALRINEAKLEPNHIEIATNLTNLGIVLQDLGELQAAREHYERALAVDEAAVGPHHPRVATDFNNLALLLQELGDPEAAKKHLERALRINEETFGPDHSEVATNLDNLGDVLSDLDEPLTAREHYERALAIREEKLGRKHPDTAATLHDLGLALQQLGDLVAARGHLERALEIDRAAFGPDHQQVATDLASLADVLQEMGELRAARQCYKQALAIRKDTLGKNHPDTAAVLDGLGILFLEMGKHAKAQAHLERALAIRKNKLGKEHGDTAFTHNSLGLVLDELNDLKAARKHYRRALKIWKRVHGDNHEQVAVAHKNLGSLLQDLGEPRAAREHLERALEIDRAALGPDSPEVATDLSNLSYLLEDLGDLQAARNATADALTILEKSKPADHPDIEDVRWQLEYLDDLLA
jgi:tetratricopeptide (TPR) repeat protein